MTTILTVPNLRYKTVDEVRNVAVSFAGKLDVGELLTGTPTIIDAATVLTLSNKAVSTAELTINGATVPIGEALQFKVSGGVDGTTYSIELKCATDSTPAQTVETFVSLKVSDN